MAPSADDVLSVKIAFASFKQTSGIIKPGLTELVNQKLTPLQFKLESAIQNADKVMLNINDLLSNDTKISLQQSILNFKNISESLYETTDNLSSIISNNSNSIENSLKNIETSAENLSEITESVSDANLSNLILELKTTVTNFNLVLTKINTGDGSISKLLDNDAIFNNLEKATAELEELINDIKANPNRYVHFSIFGKNYEYLLNDSNEIDYEKLNKFLFISFFSFCTIE